VEGLEATVEFYLMCWHNWCGGYKLRGLAGLKSGQLSSIYLILRKWDFGALIYFLIEVVKHTNACQDQDPLFRR
jgi:hypothetical protein